MDTSPSSGKAVPINAPLRAIRRGLTSGKERGGSDILKMEGRCPLRALATRVAPHSISEVIAAIIFDIGKSRRAHLFSRRLCELPRKNQSQFDASEKNAPGPPPPIRANPNI